MRVALVIPVYNEDRQLAGSMCRLCRAIHGLPQWSWQVVIADNGSSDRTWEVARELEESLPVVAVRLARKGRGGALRTVWLESEADFLAYMDVDLSTDLRHLPELLEPMGGDVADVVVGSRLAPGARVERGWVREVLSRTYNRLARWMTGSRLLDHQCGFKAIRHTAAVALLPQVEDSQWFFDTELLVLAQRDGWRVRELPVDWVDDPDSRVRLLRTIAGQLRGLWRLRRWRAAVRSRGMDRRRVFT